jgi:outer membrane immunogenic protein
MKTFLLATSILFVASATPALAQDSSTTTSTPSDGATFTGPRAEIFGGWDRVGARAKFDEGGVTTTDHAHKSAWTGGGLLGYDVPIGDSLTVGGFGSYAISSGKFCYGIDDGVGCVKANRDIEGGARIGYKVGGRALVYGKGAYVNSRLGYQFAADGVDLNQHSDRSGWRAGAGVEFAVTKHAYVKAEYDYTRLSSYHAGELSDGGASGSLRYDRNQVLGGFGVHF